MDFRKLFEHLQQQTEQMKAKRLGDIEQAGMNLGGLNPEQAKDFAQMGEQIGQFTPGSITKKLPPGIIQALESGGAKRIATVEGGVKLQLPEELAAKFGMSREVTIPNQSLGKGDFGNVIQKTEAPTGLGKVFFDKEGLSVGEQIKNSQAAEELKQRALKTSRWQDLADAVMSSPEGNSPQGEPFKKIKKILGGE